MRLKNVIDVGDVMRNNNDNQNKTDFPAILITLEEIRHLYDLEESRRQSLENKAGILIAVIGVLFTISPILDLENILFPLYILLIIALILSLLVFKITKYKIPHKKYDDFYQYAQMNNEEVMNQFLLNYIVTMKDVEKQNNKKVIYLEVSFLFTLIAWIYMVGCMIHPSLIC